jgi:bifunctional non-homologous end joining protein LigD
MNWLDEYRRKREFDKTPEPSGAKSESSPGNSFVVQKHAATRLHYDFRLEIDGVLKSWAVPKGPSLNPGDKRLAVQTEDHPLDYAEFEGKIPPGNYGAGTVMVWDRGTYQVEGAASALKQVQRGEIKFSLNGEKLRGSFVLVKLKRSEKGNEWLMIKHKDALVDAAWDIDLHDGSVLTGRTLEEIAEELHPKRSPSPLQAADLHVARKSPIPGKVEPMLATLVDKPFSDPDWLFELKWDGMRALAWIKDGALTLRARSGADITQRYPELQSLPKALGAKNAILDGEIVVLDAQGRSNFERLQQRMHTRVPPANLLAAVPVVYYLFDVLYFSGYDLRHAPLLERKQFLRRLLSPGDPFRYSDHQEEHGKELFELARQNGLEGIVAKRADSLHTAGRSTNWMKVKATRTLDAVIGGWTESPDTGLPFGALLLGLYDGAAQGLHRDSRRASRHKNTLRFIGHVGSGFDAGNRKVIAAQLKAASASASPFDPLPKTNEKAFWTSPSLIARVKFSGWTQEHSLRHPVFLGLREDVRPADLQWEGEAEPAPNTNLDPDPPPAVVRSPKVGGAVLKTSALIEAELFDGRAENINIEIDGKRLHLTNLNKVYFPESGYTKRDLLAYYYRVAEYILPYLRNRPLVLRRYPNGIHGQAFFQKDVREGLPDWFKTVPVASEVRGGEDIHYAVANDTASLLFLTGLGCIDHNPWPSPYDDPERPDYFFFDLDPSEGTEFSVVVKIARAVYEKLQALKLQTFLKTSGATGIHLYIPVEHGYTYEQVRTFAEIVARIVATEHPSLVTSERTVAKRPSGRVLIDVQQNAHGKPLAAPYSVRAFPKAPVSAPLLPQELKTSLRPETLNIKTIFKRIDEKGDLWAGFWNSRQKLEPAIELLVALIPAKPKKHS